MTFHDHVSDVNNPLLLTSLILYYRTCYEETFGKEITSLPRAFSLRKNAKENLLLATLPNCYAIGFGPSAYNAKNTWSKSAASGLQYRLLDFEKSGHRSKAKAIEKQIKNAKAAGYVAIIVKIVQNNSGTILLEEY